MPKDVLSNGGDKAISSNYQMVATAGQYAAGKVQSDGMVLQTGFHGLRNTRRPASDCNGEIIINSTLTVDNYYKLYYGNSNKIHYVGGDTSWGIAEIFKFSSMITDYIYVVAWSDHGVAQGFLGQFSNGDKTIFTSDSNWQVYATKLEYSSDSQLIEYIKKADLNNAWTPTFVGKENGMSPWGKRKEFSDSSKWIWYESENCPNYSNPINGGCNHDEYLIFR